MTLTGGHKVSRMPTLLASFSRILFNQLVKDEIWCYISAIQIEDSDATDS